MPKGQKLISHVKITNTSSGKVVMLDGDEAGSVINQIDNLTVENRNKAYIRYQDQATKNKIVLELCCVEIERLPNTVEEYDARECELDCCEQQFFGTVKTSVNQQTGEFVKKSQPSVPDKPSTPDKPKEDTPSQPTENGGSTGNTDSGEVTPSNPSENNGGTDNGNTSTTEPTTPSENNGNSDSGTSNNGSTDSPTTPSENTGNTDSGTSTQPSDNNGTTPSNPSENGGSAGNAGTDNGSTSPSENNSDTGARRAENLIVLQDYDDNYSTLLDFTVQGVVGDTVSLGDFIKKQLNSNQEQGKLNEDGNFEKNGIVYTSEKITPNLRDYLYTIKESNDDENSYTYEYIPLKRTTTDTSSDRG